MYTSKLFIVNHDLVLVQNTLFKTHSVMVNNAMVMQWSYIGLTLCNLAVAGLEAGQLDN